MEIFWRKSRHTFYYYMQHYIFIFNYRWGIWSLIGYIYFYSECDKKWNFNNEFKKVLLSLSFSGEMAVLYLYMRYRYNWNEVTFSMFSTFGMVTNLIGKKITCQIKTLRANEDVRRNSCQRARKKFLRTLYFSNFPIDFIANFKIEIWNKSILVCVEIYIYVYT